MLRVLKNKTKCLLQILFSKRNPSNEALSEEKITLWPHEFYNECLCLITNESKVKWGKSHVGTVLKAFFRIGRFLIKKSKFIITWLQTFRLLIQFEHFGIRSKCIFEQLDSGPKINAITWLTLPNVFLIKNHTSQ